MQGSRTLRTVGALGVVFGDIGTSPLYAFRAVLGEPDRLDVETVWGLTSTVVWSLILVVTVLYVGLLLRTDNEGEGGLLALLGLLRGSAPRRRMVSALTVVALVGAALFIGDGVVTPAISVLSAAEGLEVAEPAWKSAAVPVAVVILAGVFLLQRVGSGRVGALYGPVMAVWFAVLAVTGGVHVVREPSALEALSPHWAVQFFVDDPLTAFLALGSVILAVTGAEALYADLGHFGRAAITRAWLCVVLPALLLAYLGEAAAVVGDPAAAADPFYAVVPTWATIPVLVLATLATVIASEAVIAGVFTVLHQAGGLSLFPFLRTRHPSPEEGGRIYLPAANWALALAVLLVVVGFGSSEALASAYGVAVAGTISCTVVLYLALDRSRAGRTTWRQVAGAALLLVVLAFVAATLPKVATGGWLPLAIGLVGFVAAWTWWGGSRRLAAARQAAEGPPDEVLDELTSGGGGLHRPAGAAVFLTEDPDITPFALRAVVEAGRFLPGRVVLLSWRVADTPGSSAHETDVTVERFRHAGVVGVSVVLGYRERLDVEHVLSEACCREPELLRGVDASDTRYVVSEAIPSLSSSGGMARWRQRVFLAEHRLATDRVEQLALPRDRTLVIGREFDV